MANFIFIATSLDGYIARKNGDIFPSVEARRRRTATEYVNHYVHPSQNNNW
jgi:hypothetical protein